MPGARGPEPRRTLAVFLIAAVALWVAACAPRVTVAIPGGDSRPDPGAEAAFDAATNSCRVLRSRSMELALAGRVRDQVVRGTIQAATTSSGDLRLEGVAPFGAPLFVLVSSGERASLLLPREARMLRDAATVDVLDALVGLRLTAADLHALLTGCVVSAPAVRGGRAYGSDWWAVDIGPRQSAFLRRSLTPLRVEAARLDSLDIGYTAFNATSPREVMLVAPGAAGTPSVRLRVRLGQVEDNPALPAEAFRLDASPGTTPLPLDELQARGLRLGSTR